MSREVVVVGGGLAGIAAALRCCDAGHRVTLLEARPRLGGMTFSFQRGGLTVDNGQQVFLRCCTAYRALLRRLGTEDAVFLQDRMDIPVRALNGRQARLRRNRLPAPLHLAGTLARYRMLSSRQRIRLTRAALALRRLDRGGPETDHNSFGSWLASHRQDQMSIDAVWDLVGRAMLNIPAVEASLRAAATVFQIGLLAHASAGDIGWSRIPLQRLHGDAALRALLAAGATVVTGAQVTAVQPRWTIATRRTAYRADAVILAVPADQAARLAPGLPGPAQVAAVGTSPIVNLHVILDRPVLREAFFAGAGTAIQWVFDRTGPSGATEGQYLSVSLSAADWYIDAPARELRAELLPELCSLVPGLRPDHVRDFFVTRERHATFRPVPGSWTVRPGPETAMPGLYLAGAWTDSGWPATMEGAVRSGIAAADLLTSRPSGLETVV